MQCRVDNVDENPNHVSQSLSQSRSLLVSRCSPSSPLDLLRRPSGPPLSLHCLPPLGVGRRESEQLTAGGTERHEAERLVTERRGAARGRAAWQRAVLSISGGRSTHPIISLSLLYSSSPSLFHVSSLQIQWREQLDVAVWNNDNGLNPDPTMACPDLAAKATRCGSVDTVVSSVGLATAFFYFF